METDKNTWPSVETAPLHSREALEQWMEAGAKRSAGRFRVRIPLDMLPIKVPAGSLVVQTVPELIIEIAPLTAS